MILESSVKTRSAAAPGLSSGGILKRRCKSSASGIEGCGAGVAVAVGDTGVAGVATGATGAIVLGGNALKSIEVTATDCGSGTVSPTIAGIVSVIS